MSSDFAAGDALNLVVSGVGLVVAVVLLVQAFRVRRLATGGAIAKRISFVVLATICLAASALLGWVVIFVPYGFSASQMALASRLLVIAAMALLAAYFFGVSRAMQSFLNSLTGEQLLDSATAADVADEPAPAEPGDAEQTRG